MMNPRVEFDTILKRYGHNVMLQRRSEPHATPGATAVFEDVLEIQTVRHTLPEILNVAVEAKEGILHTVERIYYFRYDAVPREGDRIYENIEGFPNSMMTFIVDYAEPMNGKGGEVTFWTVGATREQVP